MSTKIYNGYKFKEFYSLPALSALLSDTRKQIIEKAVAQWHQHYTRLYTGYLDSIYDEVNDPELPVVKLIDNAVDVAIQNIRKNYRNPLDFNAEIAVKEHNGILYCGLFCENKAISQQCVELLGLEPYYYFDNSDKPEELTDEDWETRAHVWEEILGGLSWTDMGFLSYELAPVDIISGWVQFTYMDKALLDKAKRAKIWAKRKLIDEKLAVALKDSDSPKMSELTSALSKIEAEIKNHQHDEAMQQYENVFMQTAPEIIVENFRSLKPWS